MILHIVKGIRKVPGLSVGLLTLSLASGPAWAAISSCPANPTTTLLSTYSPQSSANGCSTVNATYSNFAVVDPTTLHGATIGTYTLPNSGTFIAGADFTNTFLTQVPTGVSTPGNIEFSAPGPDTHANTADTNFCASNSGSGGWCNNDVSSSQISSFVFTTTYTSAVTTFGITGQLISHSSGGGGTGGANAIVFEEICAGLATFVEGCSGGSAPEQVLQAGIINGNFNTLPFSVSGVFAPNTVFSARIIVLLQNNNGAGSFATLLPFDTINTPEPQTAGFVAFGLAGLAFLRFRKRR